MCFFFGVIFYLICRSSLVLPVVVLTPLCAWRALQTNVYLIRSVSLLMAYTRCVAFLLCCPAPFFARCLVSLSLPLSHLLFRFSCLVFFADELVFKGPEEATTAVACLPACHPRPPRPPIVNGRWRFREFLFWFQFRLRRRCILCGRICSHLSIHSCAVSAVALVS